MFAQIVRNFRRGEATRHASWVLVVGAGIGAQFRKKLYVAHKGNFDLLCVMPVFRQEPYDRLQCCRNAG